jgi:hypothetical protein
MGVLQPLFGFERQAHHLASDGQAELENVHYLEGLGWRLRGQEFSVGAMQESDSEALTESGGMLQLAPGHAEFTGRGTGGLPGIPGVPAGSKVFQKRIPAGEDWDQKLTSDQAATPSPDATSDLLPMDRVALTTQNFGPGESHHLRIYVPGGALSSSGTVASLYFWDAPGGPESGSSSGTGHYALKLGGSGTAQLFEARTGSGWMKRSEFRWAASTMVAGTTHEIHITSGQALGQPIILFHFDSISKDERVEGAGGGFAIFAKQGRSVAQLGVRDRRSWTYTPPRAEPRTAAPGPMRLDVRRDIRPILQLFRTKYPESGWLLDSPFSLDFYPLAGELIKAEWYGTLPAGTSMNLVLEDALTGAELPDQTLIFSDEQGGVITCSLPPGVRHLRARVHFDSSPDRLKTPTLTSLRFSRRATLLETGSPSVTLGGPESEDILLQTRLVRSIELVQEGGEKGLKMVIEKRVEETPLPLNTNEKVAVKVVQAEDGATLFLGRIQAAIKVHEWIAGGEGRLGKWQRWEVYSRPEDQKIASAKPPRRFSWWDIESNQPMKVTELIRVLLSGLFPSGMIDLPDLDQRLLAGFEGAWLPEPESDLKQILEWLSEGMLASRLCFRPGLGSQGQWNLVPLFDDASSIMAKLFRAPPSGVLPHWVWEDEGLPAASLLREECEEWVMPPLASQILVEGRSHGSGSLLSQLAVNVAAFPLFALPEGHPKRALPSSPDWLGSQQVLTYRDEALSDQASVDQVCRRLYDAFARGFSMLRARIPLILFDDSGILRPLQEGDRLELDEEVWRVHAVDHVWTKDAYQWSDLTLAKGNLLPSFRREGMKGWLERGVRGALSLGPLASFITSGSRLAATQAGLWTVLAAQPSAPIQDLDPDSEGYGDFLV